MPSRLFMLRACSILALALALVAVASSPALADAKTENAAKALEQKAMQEDYLATDFDKALEKLNQASNKCGGDKCSSIIRAQIKIEIGCVQIAGKQNRDSGIASFVDALKIDSNVKVDEDLRSKEIDAAFAEAKKKVGSSAAAAPPAGDFELQPAAAQLVRTPLPIYVVYSGTETLVKVVAKYKAFGMTEWKSIEAKSMDKGWGAEIPCVDVQQGGLVYYVQGFNANNDPVATSGDRNNPFKTAVRRDFSGDPPHFPGKDPPRQCADAGDCPPDFPGCKKPAEGTTEESNDSSLKGEGQDCEEDSECQSSSCGSDKTCKGGGSSGGKSKRRKFWVGSLLEARLDAPPQLQERLPPDARGDPGQHRGVLLHQLGHRLPVAHQSGRQQPDRPDPLRSGSRRGFVPANFRIALSFDYAATKNLLVGARVGFVINTYDGQAAKNEGKTFAPIHLEARGTWVFGEDPFAKAGLAPYAMLGAGVAETDAKVTVAVAPAKGSPQNYTAWDISGPGFFSIGAGVRFAFTPRVALLAGPRLNVAFGSGATLLSIGPEVGLQFGF